MPRSKLHQPGARLRLGSPFLNGGIYATADWRQTKRFKARFGEMIDHILVSRALLAGYETAQVDNELLHDESIAFATDVLYPESDHAPAVASFVLA